MSHGKRNPMQITPAEIAETLAMVSKQHLDIRTITLGLNLRGCTDSSMDAMARKVYDRMTTAAERLVPTAEQLEREYGIPIVNKRISVTPIAEICAATDATDLTPIAVAMDKAGKEVGVDFVGGFSALVHKGASAADLKLMDSIPHALSVTDNVCSSVNVGSTRAGINMDAVYKMAQVVRATAEATAVTLRLDVLVARMQPGETMPSSFEKMERLTSRSSTAASMTTSALAASCMSNVPMMRGRAASRSSAAILPRATSLSQAPAMPFRPLSTNSCFIS